MPASFETLFEQNMARLWNLALRVCGTREDAEDLLQEAAVIGFRAFDRFEQGSNFAAWMSAILVNAHRNRLRASARRVDATSLDAPIGEGEENTLYDRLRATGSKGRQGDPQARLLDRLDNATIARAFMGLPPDFRECCALFWVSGLPYEEIARALDVPLGTVRSRLHRGRKLLQRALWELAVERGLVKGDAVESSRGTSSSQSNLLSALFCCALGAARMFR